MIDHFIWGLFLLGTIVCFAGASLLRSGFAPRSIASEPAGAVVQRRADVVLGVLLMLALGYELISAASSRGLSLP